MKRLKMRVYVLRNRNRLRKQVLRQIREHSPEAFEYLSPSELEYVRWSFSQAESLLERRNPSRYQLAAALQFELDGMAAMRYATERRLEQLHRERDQLQREEDAA